MLPLMRLLSIVEQGRAKLFNYIYLEAIGVTARGSSATNRKIPPSARSNIRSTGHRNAA
jgi:hypothetical protein